MRIDGTTAPLCRLFDAVTGQRVWGVVSYCTRTHRLERRDTDDAGRIRTVPGTDTVALITETRELRVEYLPDAED